MNCVMFERFLEEYDYRYKLSGPGYEIACKDKGTNDITIEVWTRREMFYMAGLLVQPVWEKYHNNTVKKVSEILNGRALALEKIPIVMDYLKKETIIYRFLCWRLERVE